MIYPIEYGTIPMSDLAVDRNEVLARLQMSRNSDIPLSFGCVEELEKSISCKFSAVRTSVMFRDGKFVDCGFGEVLSTSLSKNLKDCRECFVFTVTLGIGVDRYLGKLALTSPSNHFIADAFASAYAESAADKVETFLCGNLKHRPRFSPGYGDLDLSCQAKVLELTTAGRLLGISLNKSLLMSPMKTITAIVGIENEQNQ